MLSERELLLNCASLSKEGTCFIKRKEILERKDLNWNYLLSEADYHGLTSLLYYNLKREEFLGFLPREIVSKLETKYHAVAFSNLKLIQELRCLLTLFSKAEVEVIILKGPVFDEVVYPQRGLRPFADLDILIHPGDIEKTENILSGEGYTMPDGISSKRFYRYFHFEIPFVNEVKNGIYIEIHWDLLPRWRLHSPAIFEIWKRREVLSKDAPLFSLGAEDMIIYSCAHIDLHAYMNRYQPSSNIRDYVFKLQSRNKLVWFSDILETIRLFGQRINWERVTERAKSWGVERAIYTNLLFTEKLFTEDPVSKEINCFPPAYQSKVKKGVILLIEKFCFPSKRKGLWEKKLGFRRLFSWVDLVEYIFPDRSALEARYTSGRMFFFYRLKYRWGCLFAGLKALFMLILK